MIYLGPCTRYVPQGTCLGVSLFLSHTLVKSSWKKRPSKSMLDGAHQGLDQGKAANFLPTVDTDSPTSHSANPWMKTLLLPL